MSKKTFRGVIACVIVVVLLAAAWLIGWRVTGELNPANWGKQEQLEENKNSTELIAISDTGKKMLRGNSYAMPRAMAFVGKPSTYSAAKEFNVKATLSNKYINGKFDWAVEFDNPASAWAMGKDVEEHVQVEPTADGSATATVKYIAVFNEPIKVTATLRGSEQSDSCTIDCLKNCDMTSCWLDTCDFEDCLGGGCLLSCTTGTVFADYQIYYARIILDDVFTEAVQSYLKFDINIHSFDFTAVLATSDFWEDKNEHFDSNIQYSITSSYYLAYADFIDNFDGFDEEHKEAIYYAWYHAALDNRDAMHFELGAYAYVNGVNTGIAVGYESNNFISGAYMGEDIQPSVTLNTNVIF